MPYHHRPVITACDEARAIKRPCKRAYRHPVAAEEVERLRLKSLIDIYRSIFEASGKKTIGWRPCNSAYRGWHLVLLQDFATERIPHLYSLIGPARDDGICSYRRYPRYSVDTPRMSLKDILRISYRRSAAFVRRPDTYGCIGACRYQVTGIGGPRQALHLACVPDVARRVLEREIIRLDDADDVIFSAGREHGVRGRPGNGVHRARPRVGSWGCVGLAGIAPYIDRVHFVRACRGDIRAARRPCYSIDLRPPYGVCGIGIVGEWVPYSYCTILRAGGDKTDLVRPR